MAEILYVDQSTYSRYETGATALPVCKIQIIIDKFNVDPCDFFNPSINAVKYSAKGGNDGSIEGSSSLPKELFDKLFNFIAKDTNEQGVKEPSGQVKGSKKYSKKAPKNRVSRA